MQRNFVGILALFLSFNALANCESTECESTATNNEATFYPGATPWGLAIGIRHAEIPYITQTDKVNDVVPLIFLEGENSYIKGMEAGFHLNQDKTYQVSLFTRLRFFDIPREYQNRVQEDSFDMGLRYRYKLDDNWLLDSEVLTDGNKRPYAVLKTSYYWQQGRLEFWPSIQLDWRSAEFNTRYFGLGLQKASSSIGVSANIEARLHLVSNLYLLGRFGISYLNDDISQLVTIKDSTQTNSFLGFSFFPTPEKRARYQSGQSDSKGYIRFAHGWASPSSLKDIIKLNWQQDPENNQLNSVFYGYPLTKTLFGVPIELYLHTGVASHNESSVQQKGYEGVVAIKAYYSFDWPVTWRIGFAEGLSFISRVTYIEGSELVEEGYRPSKLLNYLDVSADVNLGQLFRQKSLNNLWLGVSVHHRSGIFEGASQFGRVNGGSNYNSIYLQWDF